MRVRVGVVDFRGGGGGAVHEPDEAVELAARGVAEVAGVGADAAMASALSVGRMSMTPRPVQRRSGAAAAAMRAAVR